MNPKIQPPVISSINPNSGSYKGGKMVEIRGEHFMPGAKVFFDGIPATNVQVANSTTIFATLPPHKPCYGYINDISISPYALSSSLVNVAVKAGTLELGAGGHISTCESLPAPDRTAQSGCIVNVVVAHPSLDQRESVLRGGFTYTGYETPWDDVTLYVSKYSPMGTFENNAANWRWLTTYGLWNIIEDSHDCIPKPYPSGTKAMYYGNKKTCNYNNGERNYGDLYAPFIKVDRADATIRFKYYRDVEYNPSRSADLFKVFIRWDINNQEYRKDLLVEDSTAPSEKAWTQTADLPVGDAVGNEIMLVFSFDTVDGDDNDHSGIAIDNIELIGAHWSGWSESSGEVILNWTGGLPKYFVYRGTSPEFMNNSPELRAYTPFPHKYENSLNDDKSYYYQVR